MLLNPWNEPSLKDGLEKKWSDRSLWFWSGLVIGAYILAMFAIALTNQFFPAPFRGDLAEHDCVLRADMMSYYVCDGFFGADALAALRNLPTWSWSFPAFAILALPNSLLVIVPFIVMFIAFVWFLRGTVRLFAKSKA